MTVQVRPPAADLLRGLKASDLEELLAFLAEVEAETLRGYQRCKEAAKCDPSDMMKCAAARYKAAASGVRLVASKLRWTLRWRRKDEEGTENASSRPARGRVKRLRGAAN